MQYVLIKAQTAYNGCHIMFIRMNTSANKSTSISTQVTVTY